jgi:hypothetical protein
VLVGFGAAGLDPGSRGYEGVLGIFRSKGRLGAGKTRAVPALNLPIPGAMHNGQNSYLVRSFIDPVDDNVGRLDEFARAFNQTWPTYMRKTSNPKPIDARSNAPDQIRRSTRASLGNPV